MAYKPKHQPQLTGISTASVDCGVRSTQMAIGWATRGKVVPGVRNLRNRMGVSVSRLEATNPNDWTKAITSFDTAKELAGKFERLTAETIIGGEWYKFHNHLKKGKGAIGALDYGDFRRALPRKTGSESFDGYHAIFFLGYRKNKAGVEQLLSFDPLLDGRYRGCPTGPVWVPSKEVRRAMVKVGQQELSRSSIYATNVDKAVRMGSGVDIPEEEDDIDTLHDILSELFELPPSPKVDAIIDALKDIIGVVNPEADVTSKVEAGASPPR